MTPFAGERRRSRVNERVPKRRFVDLDRPTERGHGRRSKAIRRQCEDGSPASTRSRTARLTIVRTAVVDVSGHARTSATSAAVTLSRDLSEALRPQLEPVQHGSGQPADGDRLVERSWNDAR